MFVKEFIQNLDTNSFDSLFLYNSAMTEEDAVKKSTSGGSRVAKYADNVLPMVCEFLAAVVHP